MIFPSTSIFELGGVSLLGTSPTLFVLIYGSPIVPFFTGTSIFELGGVSLLGT